MSNANANANANALVIGMFDAIASSTTSNSNSTLPPYSRSNDTYPRIIHWYDDSLAPCTLVEVLQAGIANAQCTVGSTTYYAGASLTRMNDTPSPVLQLLQDDARGLRVERLGRNLLGTVNSLLCDHAGLYAGGSFLVLDPADGSVSRAHLVQWDNLQWRKVGSDLDATVNSLSLGPDSDTVLVGGAFVATPPPAHHLGLDTAVMYTMTSSSNASANAQALMCGVGPAWTFTGPSESLAVKLYGVSTLSTIKLQNLQTAPSTFFSVTSATYATPIPLAYIDTQNQLQQCISCPLPLSANIQSYHIIDPITTDSLTFHVYNDAATSTTGFASLNLYSRQLSTFATTASAPTEICPMPLGTASTTGLWTTTNELLLTADPTLPTITFTPYIPASANYSIVLFIPPSLGSTPTIQVTIPLVTPDTLTLSPSTIQDTTTQLTVYTGTLNATNPDYMPTVVIKTPDQTIADIRISLDNMHLRVWYPSHHGAATTYTYTDSQWRIVASAFLSGTIGSLSTSSGLGSFTSCAPRLAPGILSLASTPSLPPLSGSVYAAALAPTGETWVAGSFTSGNASNIAILYRDRYISPGFRLDGPVYALFISDDGFVWLSGAFTHARTSNSTVSYSVPGLAIWDPRRMAFTPSLLPALSPYSSVTYIAGHGPLVLISGTFSTADGCTNACVFDLRLSQWRALENATTATQSAVMQGYLLLAGDVQQMYNLSSPALSLVPAPAMVGPISAMVAGPDTLLLASPNASAILSLGPAGTQSLPAPMGTLHALAYLTIANETVLVAAGDFGVLGLNDSVLAVYNQTVQQWAPWLTAWTRDGRTGVAYAFVTPFVNNTDILVSMPDTVDEGLPTYATVLIALGAVSVTGAMAPFAIRRFTRADPKAKDPESLALPSKRLIKYSKALDTSPLGSTRSSLVPH
ncbi:hypothetical protein SeMB42_g07756 [Synchytrium endobioticum]|uniref:Uncharacterized protein n=1 Tax=Synchytrium endobioticum TaxID=286115 RepID=A0A507BMK3_9FUNG|nr:hypothetical protein SeMB42_g07756 [Synchytrium endobioticum]